MGKLKGKVTKPGDNGMLKYKNESGEKIEVAYHQPFSQELGIGDNTTVNFDLVSIGEKQMAVSVNPIEKGTILDINFDQGSGTIEETESGVRYPFLQTYLRELKLDKGMVTTYSLVNVKGVLTAVSLSPVQ